MTVVARITAVGDSLTKAERRVAEVVLAEPQLVAFGTVAELASAASAGAATVVRLAMKAGFDGFSGLQQAVRFELASRLRPATERIREPATDDPVSQHLHLERDNVEVTLGAVDPNDLATSVALLSDTSRTVLVLSGEASAGVAVQLLHDLGALRPNVDSIWGNPVRVATRLAATEPGDVVIAIDLRRYERWVIESARNAVARGLAVIAFTDSRLSPLAAVASATFVVAAAGAGPFDSHVGTLALANLLSTAVAGELRSSAVERLDQAEAAWKEAAVLTDD